MKFVYILGAGVDRALGLPLADGLLRELDAFAKGDGKEISQAIKAKLGGGRRVRFSFEKYVSNQGENFAERLLTDPTVAGVLVGALEKSGRRNSEGAGAIRTVVNKLKSIRELNELDHPTAQAMASLAGESEEMADHTLLRMRGITMNPSPRNAMLRVFRDAQATSDLSPEEQEALRGVVAAMTNFEDLLTELFAGFYTSKSTDIRNYLYVSWMLWMYVRWRSFSARSRMTEIPHFYSRLSSLGPDDSVITFNYTMLGDLPVERTVRFHGDCHSYIRQDRGELFADDEAVTNAQDLQALEDFIIGLDIDVEKEQILMPAIVPPSAMKPVINRAFVKRWAEAETLMADADLLIAVGYAFNRVDSHFNDLFRSSASGKRVAVINPDLDGTKATVCGLLGVSPSTLTNTTMAGIPVMRSSSLLFVPTRCEDVSDDMIAQILSGWSS